jgi:hypothetical protein
MMTAVPASTASDPLQNLQDRYDRLAVRQLVSEVIFATTVGFVLRSANDDLRAQLLEELRKSISVKAESFANPAKAELMALEMEEAAAQLLDQIERFARHELS